jgi:hypothetical protein
MPKGVPHDFLRCSVGPVEQLGIGLSRAFDRIHKRLFAIYRLPLELDDIAVASGMSSYHGL